jgi:pimeloyl-ACP methyl ester carboxylesterase
MGSPFAVFSDYETTHLPWHFSPQLPKSTATLEIMVEPTSRKILLRDGVGLHVREWSTPHSRRGEPIILIHGLASNAQLWDGAARALAQHGHAVVAIDLRGHGRSDKPDNGYDMASVAQDVIDIATTLHSEHPAWSRPLMIGQSWGGNIVIELAAHHAHNIRGVVAVDGGTIELQRMFPDWNQCKDLLAPPALAGTPADRLEAAMRAMHPDWPDESIAGAMANMEHLPDGTIRPWLTFDRHITILRSLWEHVPSQLYPHIEVPVLFTPATRANDPITHAKREMVTVAEEALRRGKVVWFDPADHDLHAQYPQRFADTVHDAITEGFFA